MFTLDKEAIQKEIVSGGLNKLIVLYGILLFFIAGGMGGNISFYVTYFIAIPLVFIFLQKIPNIIGWITSIISLVYIGLLYSMIYVVLSPVGILFYVFLLWLFYRYISARSVYFSKKQPTPSSK